MTEITYENIRKNLDKLIQKYEDRYEDLQYEYTKLENEYIELENGFINLKNEHLKLADRYFSLSKKYENLIKNFHMTYAKYNALNKQKLYHNNTKCYNRTSVNTNISNHELSDGYVSDDNEYCNIRIKKSLLKDLYENNY